MTRYITNIRECNIQGVSKKRCDRFLPISQPLKHPRKKFWAFSNSPFTCFLVCLNTCLFAYYFLTCLTPQSSLIIWLHTPPFPLFPTWLSESTLLSLCWSLPDYLTIHVFLSSDPYMIIWLLTPRPGKNSSHTCILAFPLKTYCKTREFFHWKGTFHYKKRV